MKNLALILTIAFSLQPSAFPQVRFDGVDDVLYSNHTAQLGNAFNFTNVITVSFWLVKEAGMAASCEFLGKGRLLNGNNLHWSIRDSSGKFEWNYASPSSTFHNFTTTSAFTATNVPIHVGLTMIWGNSNATIFYVNGSRTAATWTAGASNNLGVTNGEPFEIGRTYAGSNFKGSLFEVAVWNDILTDPEMGSLGQSRLRGLPLRIRTGSLRFYHPLTAELFPPWAVMSGSNAMTDLSSYRNPLTPLNSPTQHPMRWFSPMR